MGHTFELSDEQLESVVGGWGVNIHSYNGNGSNNDNGNFSNDGNKNAWANSSTTVSHAFIAGSAVGNDNGNVQNSFIG